jgi:uncharacterized membrane protein YesL/ribosomal protein S18 acetylase RimI-like enzyme
MDDFLKRSNSIFNRLLDWIYVLVVINACAIIGTVIGFVVFGFFPALMASYVAVKKTLDQEDIKPHAAFIEAYRSRFKEANLVGYVFALFWTILILSWFYYANDPASTFHVIGIVVIGFLSLVFFVMTIYLPMIFVYFPRFNKREYMTFTILIALGMPLTTLVITLNTLFFYAFVFIRLITLFPFLAFSLPALINLFFVRKKLLDIFTVYRDEQVTIRTLNSYPKEDRLFDMIEEMSLGFTFEDVQNKVFENVLLDRRLSLVLLDQTENIRGFMGVYVEEQDVAIGLLYIDPSYRNRGHGKRMIEELEKRVKASNRPSVIVGHDSTLFPKAPLNTHAFFRKMGYSIDRSKHDNPIKIIRHERGRP